MGKTQTFPEAIHSPVGKRDINKKLESSEVSIREVWTLMA